MNAILNGTILLPDQEVSGQALLYNDHIVGIVSPGEARCRASCVWDAHGAYIAPGLIDTHVHGYAGVDTVDATPAALRRIAAGMLENGVTAFLPTCDTSPWPVLERTFLLIRDLMTESRQPDFHGAQILGVHSEGPFINPARKGAMNPLYIQPFNTEKIMPFADVIRILTLAPELPGAEAFMQSVRTHTDIVLSIGHSAASYKQTVDAIQSGITRVTHLFNAMPPLHHREPGIVGAALTTDLYTELIADCFHVSPILFPLLALAKGNRLVLITDTGRYVGMPDGDYEEDGRIISLNGPSCRLQDGTIASSVLHLNQAVKNYRDFGKVPFVTAIRAASLTPAESIGFEKTKGSIMPGKDADIVLLDHDCTVLKTIVRGRLKYENPDTN